MCNRSQRYGDNAIDRTFCANFRNEFLAVHLSLKSSLRARAADYDWVSHLPLVLLGL